MWSDVAEGFRGSNPLAHKKQEKTRSKFLSFFDEYANRGWGDPAARKPKMLASESNALVS